MTDRFNYEREIHQEPQDRQSHPETPDLDVHRDAIEPETNQDPRGGQVYVSPPTDDIPDKQPPKPEGKQAAPYGSAQVFDVEPDQKNILTQNIKGMSVVSLQSGEKIGSISDIVIDGDKLQVAGLILSKGTLFNREIEMIPAEEIHVWGQDVVLVRGNNLVDQQTNLPDGKRWLYVDEHIRGRYVVSVDGKRIGQISDVSISQTGKLLAYHLSQVFIDGPLSESKRIDASSTHSLGEDVLIVNSVQNL